jgi:hypothetical protein
MTWSSTDTPELNSMSERKFRTLGEMTLAMLLRSGMPKDFWFDAYLAACYITVRLPPPGPSKAGCLLTSVVQAAQCRHLVGYECGGVKPTY